MTGSLGAVSTSNVNLAIDPPTRNAHAPRVAADLAILNEAALYVWLDVDLHLLATIGTRHEKLVIDVGGHSTE